MGPAKDYLPNYLQYLQVLEVNLRAYPNDESIWLKTEGIPNAAGTLAIHLLGNLNHFIGAAIGETGYKRNRPLEFSLRDIPRSAIYLWIEKTRAMLEEVIPRIDDLNKSYPQGYRDTDSTVGYQLANLLAHLSYHVGQINYHRRLLTNQ